MTRAGTIMGLNKYKLEHALYNTLAELHGARHGNIHSPDDFSFENCPQCDEILGIHARSLGEARGYGKPTMGGSNG